MALKTKISLLAEHLRQQLRVMFIQDRYLLALLALSLFLNLGLYVFLVLAVKIGSEPLVLHYSVYFGIDLIGEWYQIYFMPVVGTFIFIINIFLALFFYLKERLAGYLLAGSCFLAELFLAVSGFLVYLVNR